MRRTLPRRPKYSGCVWYPNARQSMTKMSGWRRRSESPLLRLPRKMSASGNSRPLRRQPRPSPARHRLRSRPRLLLRRLRQQRSRRAALHLSPRWSRPLSVLPPSARALPEPTSLVAALRRRQDRLHRSTSLRRHRSSSHRRLQEPLRTRRTIPQQAASRPRRRRLRSEERRETTMTATMTKCQRSTSVAAMKSRTASN